MPALTNRARLHPGKVSERCATRTAVVLTIGVLLVASAGPARAQTADGAASAAALQQQADGIANQYFHVLTRARELDGDIARNEALVEQLTVQANSARKHARARALLAYESFGTRFQVLADGSDTLDAARRVRLIDQVNATDEAAYAKFRAATRALRAQRQALDAARSEQADALAQLTSRGNALDAKLAAAQLDTAGSQTPSTGATGTSGPVTPSGASAGAAAPSGAAPPAAAAPAATPPTPPPPTAAPPPPRPTPPPGYQGTPGTNPHHDDPFLTCVRRRESGGNYGAVNPSGPYLGAYQFLQATWNGGANHAGRSDLVGVPANLASPYDQDAVAWAVYQWQGMGPWGGGCG
jgi:hypothetical protein